MTEAILEVIFAILMVSFSFIFYINKRSSTHKLWNFNSKFPSTSNEKSKLLTKKGQRHLVTVKEKTIRNGTLYIHLSFPDSNMILGLPVGMGVRLHAFDSQRNAITGTFYPISGPQKTEEFIIANTFSIEGEYGERIVEFLKEIKPGSTLEVSGPEGKFQYIGDCLFSFENRSENYKSKNVSFISYDGFVASTIGTILEIIERNDPIKLTLIHSASRSQNFYFSEILKELESTQKLKYIPVLKFDQFEWEGITGFVTSDLLLEHLPVEKKDHIVIVSGPVAETNVLAEVLPDAMIQPWQIIYY